MKITINKEKKSLLRDGSHFFYLADTCWSAFTNIREDQWITYLKKRKRQGFNVLQINILPQWDRSRGEFAILPFDEKQGKFDFSKWNEDYFLRAERMCRIAEKEGFTLALVVLWANYVSGTWANTLDQAKNTFPRKQLKTYLNYVLQFFDDFSPLYVIGGDTDFPTQETIDTYMEVFDFLEKRSPNTLKTIHVKGRFTDIPEEIADRLDLFFYQSGHNHSFINMPYYLAEEFSKKKQNLPVINSEPCYEQMPYSRNIYGRFTQYEVRKALWQSLLSDASAGITYGAHGIWSWHDYDAKFAENLGEGFADPLFWQEALYLPGANDFGFAKHLFEILGVTLLNNCNELLETKEEQIRLARSADQDIFLLYIPTNKQVKIDFDFSNYAFLMIDLQKRYLLTPLNTMTKTQISFLLHECQEDVVIIAYKREKIN